MKKTKILILFLSLSSITFAQGGHKGEKPNKEKIKSMKIAFITERLNLTPEEAQKFWPIYNEFDTKIEDIHKSLRKMHGKNVDLDEMNDADIEKMIATDMSLREKELNIQKEYHEKFKTILPIKKVAKLYKSEEDFKRDLLRKIKNHKPSGPPEMGEGRPPHPR